MFNVRIVEIENSKAAKFQLGQIGSDEGGIAMMFRKTASLNLKVHNLKVPQAHILKQEMLAIGGDAAVAREVLVNAVERSDVLLMGTVKQHYELCRRLLRQPFGMKKLSAQIREILDFREKAEFRWKIKGAELVLGRRTLVMGIVNVTPDSFSDGGAFFDHEKAAEHALDMIRDGADILDIGGESTRPGAQFVTAEDEKKRILPVIRAIRKHNPGIPISVDTYKSDVADDALKAGADIVNDISGLTFDGSMKDVVAAHGAGLVLMHTRGKPAEMQKNTEYDDFMEELLEYLTNAVNTATAAGISRESIVIDPGIGFAKSFDHNLFILKHLAEFRVLGLPLLIGLSRKAFLGKITGKEAGDRDDATAAAASLAVFNGARIVRTHNVRKTKEAVHVADSIRNASPF